VTLFNFKKKEAEKDRLREEAMSQKFKKIEETAKSQQLAAQQQFEATKLRLAKEDADRKKKDINISPPATVPTIISSLPTHTIISSPPVTVTNLPVIVPATVLNLPAIVSTPISTTPPLATAPSSSTSSAASKVTTQPQTVPLYSVFFM